jgi:hypothetical protein
MLLGSSDPFAASWYAAKYMLTPVAYYPEKTNPDLNGGYGSYGTCLINWINCMHDSGFAVTIDSSEISVYNFSIIPVELTSFSADVDDGVVILNWGTSTEMNNFGFQVERSNDRVTFDQIAFVPGFGTTTEPKTYIYRDTALSSKENYYRLKQLDLNGSHCYSNIIKVDLNPSGIFVLRQNYPNPFNSQTQITFDLYNTATIDLNIYDTNGGLVKSLINGESRDEGSYIVQWDGTNDKGNSLSSGVYFYKLKVGNFIETKSMILQK